MTKREITPFGSPGYLFECPRWHDNGWWASDMRGKTIVNFTPEGKTTSELKFDDKPGGVGWGADGAMLVVAMDSKKLLRRAPGSQRFEEFVDIASLVSQIEGFTNDMAVSKTGHAYIGFDADFKKYGMDAELGMIIHVDPNGHAAIAAQGLAFPNGIVFSPDGSTLVVVETMKPQLRSFPIAKDGSLGSAGLWAGLNPRSDKRQTKLPALGSETATMDGCEMDAEGCIWVADLRSACLRVAPGGDIVDAISLPGGMSTWACGLGGPDGKTLMLCGAPFDMPDRLSRKGSQLFVTQVDVPGIQ